MADRFPLIANSSANQIQEIPSGDQLNLSGNNIANAGVVTATTFSGSGASLTNLPAAQLSGTAAAINGSNITNLNGSAIASGTVPVARIGTGTKSTSTFYRGDGTFQVVNTDLVADSSPQLGGNLDTNGSNIIFEDNNAAFFGTGSDLKVYHDGSNNFVEARGVGDVTTFKTSNSSAADTGALAIRANGDTSRNDNIKALFGNSDDLQIYYSGSNSFIKQGSGASGNLYIQADNSSDIYIRPVPSEDGIIVKANGAVELYEDTNLKFKTGVTGDYGSIQLQNGKNGWYGVSCNGQTVFMSDGNDIGLYNDTDNEWIMKGTRNGEVQLRYNDAIKLQTTSSGATVNGTLTANTFSGSGASLTNIPAGQLTGALPAISGSNLTGINQTVVQVKEYVCRDFETQSYSGNTQMGTQLEGHITPTSSSNKIRITVCAFFMLPTQHNSSFQIKRSTNGGSSYGGLDATVQSSESVSRATGHIPSLWGRGHNWSDNVNSIATVIDSPNTTSQMYYRLFWISNDSGTLYTNYNYNTSQTGNAFCKTVSILRLEEIASSAVTLTNIT